MCKTLFTSCMALALSGALAAQSQIPQTQAPQAGQTITVSGCVQKEADVIKRSGMAGNVGMADEFVLTRAELVPAGGAPKTTEPEPRTPPATGTSGASNVGKVYRVTGDQEKDLKSRVGQRVEITGTFKHEEDARRELGAIGTSGKPPMPSGELTTANTPEITIASIKAMTADCSR